MVIYRPHRGTLADALEESKEFNSFGEMKEHIVKDWSDMYSDLGFKNPPFEFSDIVIDETKSADDKRCGWHDTRYVCVKRIGNKVYGCPQCIGMCATDYEKLTPEEVSERINNMR